MDSIKHSIAELTNHFNSKLVEFQHNLQNSSIPATSPTSNIASQFSAFRSFVLSSLESLQLQVELLSKQYDKMEMRSRRKILLVHGVPEAQNENVSNTVVKALSNHLDISDLCVENIGRCHRIGRTSAEKPRVILLKFRDLSLRNRIWYSKTSLKNTGITVSEFLTKERHETFMAARKKFGVSKSWTKDGQVIVIGPEGKRHRILNIAELNSISSESNCKGTLLLPTSITKSNQDQKDNKVSQNIRPKRTIKK